VKFERTERFRTDYKNLNAEERTTFKQVIPGFNTACDRYVAMSLPFPEAYRVKKVRNTDRIFEMTWSFSGPDGRATFEWVDIKGARGILWRRCGGHRIFQDP